MSIAARISRISRGNDLVASNRQLQKAGLANRVAQGMSHAKVSSTKKGVPVLHTGQGTGRSFISKEQADHLHQMRGRRMIAGAAALGSVSASTAMRPNFNQQQTGYRRPMTSAPPGTGRFA